MKFKSIKKLGIGVVLVGSLWGGNAAIAPRPSYAAGGFMQNSFGGILSNDTMNEDVKGSFRILSAIFYWMPILWMMFTAGGLLVTNHNNNEGGFKMVSNISIIWLILMAMMFVYDTKFVPSAGGAGIQAYQPMLELAIKYRA